jgi:hypothetical protein
MSTDSSVAQQAIELLNRAPGPSPWYPHQFGAPIDTQWGRASWVSSDGDLYASGKIVLEAPGGALLVLGMYNWVMPLGKRLVLWQQDYRQQGPTAPVKIIVLDVDLLEPIADLPTAVASVPARGGYYIPCDKAIVARTELQTTQAQTLLNHVFPSTLQELSELLILVDSSSIQEKVDALHMNRGLLIAYPARRVFEIVPQDWYNKGRWDFGYQWPTRVARDPSSSRIVGDGIRMGVFRLDEKNRNVEEWLVRRV